jgi:hypothetical protein
MQRSASKALLHHLTPAPVCILKTAVAITQSTNCDQPKSERLIRASLENAERTGALLTISCHPHMMHRKRRVVDGAANLHRQTLCCSLEEKSSGLRRAQMRQVPLQLLGPAPIGIQC